MSKAPKRPIFIEVRGLTAEDVVCEPLLKYNDCSRHVKSSSLHPIWSSGKIEVWSTFEAEVEQTFLEIPWENYSAVIDYALPDDVDKNHIRARDHFLCGEELSISGRWSDHALNPVSAIGRVLGYGAVFGDWKATARSNFSLAEPESTADGVTPADKGTSSKATDADPGAKPTVEIKRKRNALIPDYALILEIDGTPRLIGEIKTPWKHPLPQWWAFFVKDNNDLHMRRALGKLTLISWEHRFLLMSGDKLGQTVNYMIELGLRYGFLTNYNHTVFLKREDVDGKEILFCSTPIEYNARPGPGSRVSVRQCLLHMQTLVVGDSDWKLEKSSQESIIKQQKKEPMEDAKRRTLEAVRGLGNDPTPSSSDAHVEEVRSGVAALEVDSSGGGRLTRSRTARFADPPVDASNPPGRKPRKK